MKHKILLIAIFIMIGVILMIKSNGSAADINYLNYESKNRLLGITLDYIDGWSLRELKGPSEAFTNIIFIEKNKDNKMLGIFSVEIKDPLKAKSLPKKLDEFTNTLIASKLGLKDAQIISRTQKEILSSNASDILFSYELPRNLHSTKMEFNPVKERVIVLELQGKYLVISYLNAQESFESLEAPFYHCAYSIKLIPQE